MKTITRYSLPLALAALAGWGALTATAGKNKSRVANNSRFRIEIPIADPAYDEHGQLANGDVPLPAGTPVYGDAAGLCDHQHPITDPSGRTLTLAEWQAVQGQAQARCTTLGTEVNLKLTGLVPGGVYTVWLATFGAPGITPDFSAMVGLGPLGQQDGSQNRIDASADGKGELSVLQYSGGLSMGGAVTECLLDEYEVVLFLALHLDGETHGAVPGNDCTLAFPGGFSFK